MARSVNRRGTALGGNRLTPPTRGEWISDAHGGGPRCAVPARPRAFAGAMRHAGEDSGALVAGRPAAFAADCRGPRRPRLALLLASRDFAPAAG